MCNWEHVCHKMRHSLCLTTVTYICMRELPHFHHGPTLSFLYSLPIHPPPSRPGLTCIVGQVFIWDDPSVTTLDLTAHVEMGYPASAHKQGIGVAFKQPLIIIHVSFGAVSPCLVCLECSYEELSNSAVEKQCAVQRDSKLNRVCIVVKK